MPLPHSVIENELQTFSSSEVLAKVRAKDSSWRQMVPNGIAEYIEKRDCRTNSHVARAWCEYKRKGQQGDNRSKDFLPDDKEPESSQGFEETRKEHNLYLL